MRWTEKTLDQLGYVSRGKSRHRPRDAAHLYGGPYPFIQTSDVKHANLYITDYKQTYSEEGLAQSKLWPAGTLCITIAANIADTAILKFEACFPDSIIGFIPEQDKADAKFIKYLFDALLQRRFKSFTQGAAQDNLSQSKLLSIKFPVPNIDEQKKIVNILSSYDSLIEKNIQRISHLQKSAQLLYKEWFVHLRFPGHEHTRIKNGVPEGWEAGEVSDFFNTSSGGTPSRKKEEYYAGDIKWVKTQELNDSFIIDTEEKITEDAIKESSAKIFPKNTVLVAMYGATIGKTGILFEESSTNQACCALIPKDNKVSFLYGFLYIKNQKQNLLNLSVGAAQNNINQQIIRELRILIPKEQLMLEFTNIVKPMFDLILNLQQQNLKLKEAQNLLLPKLMNGEIKV